MTKVLIVEDEEILRNVYQIIVEKAGYEVEVARNGGEGLEKLTSFSPNILLLDMLMPVKTGLELLREANVKKNYPKMATIILSNLSESQTINQALELGAVEHLIKSNVLPDDLLSTIQKYAT